MRIAARIFSNDNWALSQYPAQGKTEAFPQAGELHYRRGVMELLPDRAAKKAHHWAKQGWQFVRIGFKTMMKRSFRGLRLSSPTA